MTKQTAGTPKAKKPTKAEKPKTPKPATGKAKAKPKASKARKSQEPKPMGRPSTYSDDVAATICQRLACGESLRAICLGDDMPDRTTVYDWLFKLPDFASQYTRAREEQAETMADDIVAIADESYHDHDIDENGHVRVNNEAIQRSKLRVEARKWVAAKLKPKKYGDKITQEVVGANGGAVQFEHTVDPARLSDSALTELLAARVSPNPAN